ncbi:hypothetical protein F8M41_016183 [Gigaspora margarita]|uniref:Uncharacterized protein n=1 Tax=Gigaspora margarita TaxID=4874 RepID=A0A8H4EN20_GIGMA|nr:hypothetical protein F8M41_016183 [Gigaspora margarita]
MENENTLETFEEQPLTGNSAEVEQDLAETMDVSIIGPILVDDQGTVDAPMVGQEFNNWDELDHFITLYAKSQNFVSIIRGSEYDNKVCRSRRYASKRWYVDEKQIEQESQTRLHPFIIGLNDSMNSETSIHTEQYFPDSSFHLPTIPFNETHSKVNYRKAYVTINGLSKKAIQAGLDAGSIAIQELEDFMNGFITKHAPKKKDEKNKRQHNDKNETTSDYSSSDEDFSAIENLVVHSKRGAPRKKRIKSSHELESKNSSSAKHSQTQKIRKPTQCQQCQNTGHNKAGCEAWHKRQGISYSY